MSNIEAMRKRKKEEQEKHKKDEINLVTLEYKKQKESIQSIMKQEWYKTIKNFWITQHKQAMLDLEDVRFTDLQEFWRVQSKAKMSKKFLTFLCNLEG